MKQTRSKKGKTKEKILAAAIETLEVRGTMGFTNSEIASRAGVAQPLLNYHYPTFESLFQDIVQFLLDELRRFSMDELEQNSDDPLVALLSYAKAPILWAKAYPGHSRLWGYFYHLAAQEGSFRQINDQIRKVGRDRISLLLYKYQDSKNLKLIQPWTIQSLEYAIQAQITGTTILASTETDGFSRPEIDLEKTILNLLSGAFSKA